MKEYTFKEIPEKEIVGFSEGVIAAFEALGFEVEMDETGPPDANDEVTFKVWVV